MRDRLGEGLQLLVARLQLGASRLELLVELTDLVLARPPLDHLLLEPVARLEQLSLDAAPKGGEPSDNDGEEHERDVERDLVRRDAQGMMRISQEVVVRKAGEYGCNDSGPRAQIPAAHRDRIQEERHPHLAGTDDTEALEDQPDGERRSDAHGGEEVRNGAVP